VPVPLQLGRQATDSGTTQTAAVAEAGSAKLQKPSAVCAVPVVVLLDLLY
jgi:hypothetical protein